MATMSFMALVPSGASVANLMGSALAEPAHSRRTAAGRLKQFMGSLQKAFGLELGHLVGQARVGRLVGPAGQDLLVEPAKEGLVQGGDRVVLGVEQFGGQKAA